MINIVVIGDPIKKVVIDGHANFGKLGNDIVCAGVSAIATGAINALNEITKIDTKFLLEDGHLEIEFNEDDESQIVAKTMIVQLKTIENEYSKNIKIIYS